MVLPQLRDDVGSSRGPLERSLWTPTTTSVFAPAGEDGDDEQPATRASVARAATATRAVRAPLLDGRQRRGKPVGRDELGEALGLLPWLSSSTTTGRPSVAWYFCRTFATAGSSSSEAST